MADKTYKEYLNEVGNRYKSLSDDEKDVVRSMRGTSQGLVLSKVLGNEMALADLGVKRVPTARPKKRGLATR
jgi:esterase/lipase|tara:strand:+ start:1250 stop:1465 length:216 start_codon:yes stop_codon:yes gene_type:complete